MVNEEYYFRVAKDFFSFLITDFGMRIRAEKKIGKAFYDLQYEDDQMAISISYENLEDYLQVTVFITENGQMPDYDDTSKTFRLSSLNNSILPEIDESEIKKNAKYFQQYKAKGNFEIFLLKKAKELRLCLKHFRASL